MVRNRYIMVLTFAVACLSMATVAYISDTHGVLSYLAINSSACKADFVLRNDLGLTGSIDSNLHGRSIVEWVRYGAVHEDDTPNFLNHFYDPTQPVIAPGELKQMRGLHGYPVAV